MRRTLWEKNCVQIFFLWSKWKSWQRYTKIIIIFLNYDNLIKYKNLHLQWLTLEILYSSQSGKNLVSAEHYSLPTEENSMEAHTNFINSLIMYTLLMIASLHRLAYYVGKMLPIPRQCTTKTPGTRMTAYLLIRTPEPLVTH